MGIMQKSKPFKFFRVVTPHVCKLEAHANRILHAAKYFGGLGWFVLSRTFIKSKSIMNTSNGLSLKYVYLVSNEARYWSFEGCLYGLVCFYNKCALIKVAL